MHATGYMVSVDVRLTDISLSQLVTSFSSLQVRINRQPVRKADWYVTRGWESTLLALLHMLCACGVCTGAVRRRFCVKTACQRNPVGSIQHPLLPSSFQVHQVPF